MFGGRMFEVIEKHSQSLRTYYCVYLDDWLVLQTKNARLAALCHIGRGPKGLIAKKTAAKEDAAAQEQEAETGA
jgi:hypothetical protein